MTDYYKILQVLPTAEDEVIEGAYKKLSKKYHPDVNKAEGAPEKMKQINAAYTVLRDPVSRRLYNQKHNVESVASVSEASETARTVLESYFRSIQMGQYQTAYDLITKDDQKKTPFNAFVNWQMAVSAVFQLKRFECQLKADEVKAFVKGICYPRVFDFVVLTEEHNTIMERVERDFLLKRVVLEKGIFRVHMGFDGVEALIERFQTLTGLLAAKQKNDSVDAVTGWLTAKGLIDVIHLESERFFRYNRSFCAIMVQMKGGHVLSIADPFKKMFRKLDSLGIWADDTVLVILPETDLSGAIKTAFKIKKLITSAALKNVSVGIAVEQYRGDVQNMMHQLERLVVLSSSRGKYCIASVRGVY